MKNFKKVASVVLAMVMSMSMFVFAFAVNTEDQRGTITITNAIPGHDYSVYRIFDLISYDEDTHAYNYQVNAAWATYIDTDEAKVYFSHGTGYVTVKEGIGEAQIAEFAKKALAYAKDPAHPIAPVDTKNAVAENEGDATTAVVFDNLKLGYYLVDSSVGTACTITTTAPDIEIIDKNEIPVLEKKVRENTGKTWGEENDASIGRDVEFKITIDAKAGAAGYVVHDKMSEGLAFKSDTVVVTQNDAPLTRNNEYTVVENDLDDDCTFHIIFSAEYLATITDDDEIIINYSATVTEDAVVGIDGNTNEAYLEFGEEHKSETTPDETITYTWKFNVSKVGEVDGTQAPLAGAKFELSSSADDTKPIKFVAVKDEDDPDTVLYYQVCLVGDCTDHEHITTLVSPEDGNIDIRGLDSLAYDLTEKEAPDGYNKLTSPIKFRINKNNYDGPTITITNSVGSANGTTITVVNKTGTELPSTGGIGTTVFYVVGGLLVAAAAVLLITKKRMATVK